jgi:signal transduction histidine kinase
VTLPPATVSVPAPGLHSPRRGVAGARVRLACGLLGAAAGVAAFVLVARDGDVADPRATAALTLAIGWCFLGSGLIVWTREEGNPLGFLMTALGIIWLVGAAAGQLDSAIGPWIGFIALNGAVAMFVHVLVAFPTGRLASPRERILVAAAYGTLVLLAPLWLAAQGDAPPRDGAAGLLRPDPFATSLGGPAAAIALLIGGALGWLLWRRWYWATRHTRHTLALVLLTGGASLVLLFAAAVADRGSPAAGRALGWAAFIAFGTVTLAVLAGILRSRLERASVAELVHDLETARTPGALRDALRRSLGDPTLRVAYWVSETRGFVDLNGRPFELPWEGSTQEATMVERDGHRVAALVHDASLRDAPELLQAVTSAAGLALENERLHAELRAHVDDLRESRARIVEAGDAERRRLERNLHDGAQQRLVGMALQLRLVDSKLRTDPQGAVPLVEAIREELTEALDELRELARGIHPAILSNHGLRPALEVVAKRSSVPVKLSAPEERFPAPVEAALYYVVSEALTNVAKYAHASSVTVEVARSNGRAVLAIADDGVGGADLDRGSGLRGLADRIAALDGRLHIDSPPSSGTRIYADIPCAE